MRKSYGIKTKSVKLVEEQMSRRDAIKENKHIPGLGSGFAL
jgi:hypothetical protein